MLARAVGLLIGVTMAVVTPVSETSPQGQSQSQSERTTIFTCGNDESLPQPIPMRWTSIVLAGDGRLFRPCAGPVHPADHRENREASVISQGYGQRTDADARWRAAQAASRLIGGIASMPNVVERTACAGGRTAIVTMPYSGQRQSRAETWQPGYAFHMLMDRDVRVKKEGAFSMAVRLAEPGLDADLFSAAVKDLRGCLFSNQADADVQGLMLEALGAARYSTEEERTEAEAFLVKESHGAAPKILGAVRGLEVLFRQNPQRNVSDEIRVRLRQLVTYGVRTGTPPVLDVDARIRRVALMALAAARDLHAATLREAANDGDWQVRRLVAGRVNLSDPEQARLGDLFKAEQAFQVRYDFLGPLSRQASRTGLCAPIFERFTDPSPAVVMRAMDVLAPSCTDLDEAVPQLVDWADALGRGETNERWHVASRALTTLARLKPVLAKPRLETAAKHVIWQVRAAAATTSAVLADEGVAVALMADSEQNVRNAALDALLRMKSATLASHAIDTLRDGTDYQLLRTAALVLRGVAPESRDAASNALLVALRKLTDQQTDTSRDPRVAMLDRLAEILPPERSADLLPFIADYDDAVAAAAGKAFTTLVTVPPTPPARRRRYPYQPPEDALARLPTQATIYLEQGPVTLQLLPDVAPVTVARFAALAQQGFYKDRTFHRVVPNFVVQGGSPGANEYSGTSRYMRDEVGPQAWHVRGAVGISTRGRDTGDGQIFIDLVDLPRLDRDYTVFAYVTQGMELVDRLLEGAKIVNISVR